MVICYLAEKVDCGGTSCKVVLSITGYYVGWLRYVGSRPDSISNILQHHYINGAVHMPFHPKLRIVTFFTSPSDSRSTIMRNQTGYRLLTNKDNSMTLLFIACDSIHHADALGEGQQ